MSEDRGERQRLSFDALGAELSALVSDEAVWQCAMAAEEVGGTEHSPPHVGGTERVQRVLQGLAQALAQSVLKAAEGELTDVYGEELSAVRAAVDDGMVTSKAEVAVALTALKSAVKVRVLEYARENGWLHIKRR